MKDIFTKTSTGLVPNGLGASDLFDKIPDGASVMVEYIKKRNYENHKRWFAMAKICFDMQEQFDNSEIFRKHLLMIAGHFDTVIVEHPKTKAITTQYWPKSIAFEEMDELEFRRLFKRCISGFLRRFNIGMTDEEFNTVVKFD